MDMTFKLQVFEGPLDLLLYLIEKNKVNIYDIPIVEITAQYMEYVNQMKKDNLDTLSEFLVMAATLLDIKSKMLLPKKEEEEQEQEDPRAELVHQLLEYKMYKCMANELRIASWMPARCGIRRRTYLMRSLHMRSLLILRSLSEISVFLI